MMTNEEQAISIAFYYKLWKCMKKAMSDDKLGCHCNNIVIHLGRSVESQYKYYDKSFDGWCNYFLS